MCEEKVYIGKKNVVQNWVFSGFGTCVEDEARKDAKSGTLRPPDDLLDCALYMALYQLYAGFFSGVLPRDAAKEIKRKILFDYQEQKKQFDFRRRLLKDAAQLWKNIEHAANEYRTRPTKETADNMYMAVYNVRCNHGEKQ